jgi:predicted CxxxxCH...CXXCH cytochrome family protein
MKGQRINQLLCSLAAALWIACALGCSTSATSGGSLNLITAKGEHPENFQATHSTVATGSLDQCKTCHGQDLLGGTSKVSCYTAACHHANHPVPYLSGIHTSVTTASFNISCVRCHAVSGTSPSPFAPACNGCHTAGSPLTRTACASCHGKPPVGTAFPDIAGSHAAHEALANVTGICATCHYGSDSGTQRHYDYANALTNKQYIIAPTGDVKASPAYNAKAGAMTFNPVAGTCANASCHGGIVTPRWGTALDPTAEASCRGCHTQGTSLGVPEANSYFSGSHAKHLGPDVKALCIYCHDMANGTDGAKNHLKFLNTPQMEGHASQTILFYAPGKASCTMTCHGKVHTALTWGN